MCRLVSFNGTCPSCRAHLTWHSLTQQISCLEAKNIGDFGTCSRGVHMDSRPYDQDCDICCELEAVANGASNRGSPGGFSVGGSSSSSGGMSDDDLYYTVPSVKTPSKTPSKSSGSGGSSSKSKSGSGSGSKHSSSSSGKKHRH